MLSAFRAQPIHELKQRDKAKIESLLAYGDRLLVGLNNGALRIYRVNEASQQESVEGKDDANGEPPASPTKNKAKAVELLREEEKFSRRPVQQLAIVKEVNLLVSFSDGYISLHDLQTYQLMEKLDKTKGAACFTVTSNVVKDSETGVPSLVSRLAVGVKRKILCWTWQDMEQLPDVQEINLEASVKSLTWATGTKLVAGMDAGFSFVNVESGEITPINKPASRGTEGSTTELAGVRFGAVSSSGMGYMGMGSWVPKPMVTGLSNGDVLLAKDVNTLFADSEGNAMEKRQIPWALAPEAIGYSYPYLLALQPPEKGSLQIRNPDTLSLLQTIAVPNAMILHVPQSNISLAHAGKGFLVASDRVIWRMNALPYDTQLQDLIEKERFDEAISLLNLLEDTLIEGKAERIRDIMIQKATALFQDRKYRPALDLFTDAEAPPERVIKLYPPVIAGALSDHVKESDDTAAEDNIAETKLQTEPSKEPPSTPSKSLLGRMTGSHRKKDSDTTSIKTATQSNADAGTPRKAPTSKPSGDQMLEGEDLKLAIRSLCSFLVQARTRMQRYINFDGSLKEDPPTLDSETGRPAFATLLPQQVLEQESIDWCEELLKTAQLLDTTLFRAYMLASPSLAGPLFRLDNFCDPEVVQSALYETERYNDLIDFLHGKKLHRQALEMLAKFGKGEAEGEVPGGLNGPERTVGYLQQLPPELIDIVLEFVHWPLSVAPDEGMSVFLADTDNAEKMPKNRVVSYLADIDKKLEARYLEHIIGELNDQDPDFHQRLVDTYLEELKGSQDEKSEEDAAATKSRLEAFLTKSRHYNKAKTFRQLPSDNPTFYESRAIVLSAMGNHKQALSIYVFQLKDYVKAEDYCNRTFIAEQQQQDCLIGGGALHEKQIDHCDEKGTNIFAVLLGLYLRPPEGEEKRWPQALDLLSRHGTRLPASSTLDFMPDDLAVRELTSYFQGRMRLTTSQLYSSRITKALESVRQVNAERHLLVGPDRKGSAEGGGGGERVLGGRNQRVRIGEDDHCRVCLRRFGASAVRVYPGGEVVHYGCVQRREAQQAQAQALAQAKAGGGGGSGGHSRGWG